MTKMYGFLKKIDKRMSIEKALRSLAWKTFEMYELAKNTQDQNDKLIEQNKRLLSQIERHGKIG